MSSEIRVNKINNRSGLSTVTFTNTGPIISGVTTFQDRVDFESNGLNVTSGSVGIGTDSPQARLHLSSGGPGLQWTDTDNNSDSRIRYNGSLFIFEADRNDEVEDSTFSFRIDGANIAQEKVRISSGIGSVGIRSDKPKTPVDINCYNSDNDAYRGTVKINRYGHILQQNNTVVNNTGVSSYWSLAPRDNGDFDISFDEVDAPNTFNASGFDVLTLQPNGDVSIPNGNLIMASGQGIDFQNTGAGSSTTATSHILDDYEEGSWTCTLIPSSGFTPTNNNVTGYYTKVGRQVTVIAIASMDTPASLGSYTNDNTGFSLNIRGLPFIIIDDLQARSAPTIGVFDDIQTPNGQLTGHGTTNNSQFSLFVAKDNGSTRTSPTLPVSQTCNLHFSFTYFTNQ